MKKNDLYGNQEIEKILKEKMNGLSSSIDCFDKISARAFPEKNPDFSDCELTVTDLENVTGKRRPVPVLKWVSAAAAIVICVGVLPKTALMNNLRNSLVKKSDKKSYGAIICEIKKETAENDYMIYDIPLDYYSKNDVLVTPFFSCPFENKADSDERVRIFVKTCGGIQTNQVYAVEYSGEYDEANFKAAAESKAKFTGEETKQLELSGDIMNLLNYDCAADAQYAFGTDEEGNLTDKNGENISAASFSTVSYFKDDENRINSVTSDILYYHLGTTVYASGYFYDINSSYLDGTEIKNLDIPENLWKESVYSNGVSAFPSEKDSDENDGGFTKTRLFLDYDERYGIEESTLYYMNPALSFVPDETAADEKITETITVSLENIYQAEVVGKDEIACIAAPYNELVRNTMAVYIPYDRISNNNYSALSLESSVDVGNRNYIYLSSSGDSLKTVDMNYEEREYELQLNSENFEQTVLSIEEKIESGGLSESELEKLNIEMENLNQQIAALQNYQIALEAQRNMEEAQNAEKMRKAEEELNAQKDAMQPSTTNAVTYGE